jgi:hypothetical protein
MLTRGEAPLFLASPAERSIHLAILREIARKSDRPAKKKISTVTRPANNTNPMSIQSVLVGRRVRAGAISSQRVLLNQPVALFQGRDKTEEQK